MDLLRTATRRRTALTTALLVAVAVTAGCGQQAGPTAGSPKASSSPTSGASPSTEGMGGMDMGGSTTPSQPAKMICSDEIRDAVQRTFALPRPVTGQGAWKVEGRTYSCTYRLPGGVLRLSVQDALTKADGAAHFRTLRTQLPSGRAIRGVEGFGLPSLETDAGQVAFLKDGKTLVVDASAVSTTGLPSKYSRSDVAYAVAAAVVACWSE